MHMVYLMFYLPFLLFSRISHLPFWGKLLPGFFPPTDTTHEIADGAREASRPWAHYSHLSQCTYYPNHVFNPRIRVNIDCIDVEKTHRLQCSAIVLQKQLTSNCYIASICTLPEPTFSFSFASNWLNWISCGFWYLTEVYWYHEALAASRPYRYTGGKCSDMITLQWENETCLRSAFRRKIRSVIWRFPVNRRNIVPGVEMQREGSEREWREGERNKKRGEKEIDLFIICTRCKCALYVR